MTDLVRAELQESGVLVIRMSRPEKRNALTPAMYDAMTDMLLGSNSDPKVRAIVITGDEDCFTAGNDVSDFASGTPPTQESPVFNFIRALPLVKKPFIAAVNGQAVGVGTTMLLHADLVYAGENATFQLPFVNLALVPEAASSYLLPRLVGRHKAAEILMFGDPFSAEIGLEIGLVNKVLPDHGVLTFAIERAEALAAKPPAALAATKALLRGDEQVLLDTMDIEGKAFAKCLMSPEAQEAMQAFLERRAPDFSKFRN